MNKSTIGVLVSATMILALLVIGCTGQPPAASLEPESQLASTATFTLRNNPAGDQAILEDMILGARRAIGEYGMLAQPVPDGCYAALQSIEEAQQLLRQLDVERQVLLLGVNHCRFMAHPLPDDLAGALGRIEGTRLAILRDVGLY